MPKDTSMEQINVLLKTLALMNAGAGTVLRSADVLGYLASTVEKNKVEKNWQEALTHGKADAIFLKERDAVAVQKELEARAIPYRKLNYATRYGNMKGIVYPLKYEKEVFAIVGDKHIKMGKEEALNLAKPEAVEKELGGTATREELLKHADGGRIKKTAQVLDEAELKRYMEYAKLYKMPAVPDGPKYGKYTVYFAAKDFQKANRIKAEVAKDEVSKTWPLMRAELEWQSKNAVTVYRELANGNLKRGTAVIDENGARLDITRDGAMYTDSKGKQQHIDLDVRDGRNTDMKKLMKLKSVVHEMKNPVIFTDKELKKYDRALDKEEVIRKAQVERGRPELQKQDIEQAAQDAAKREEYEKKLNEEMPAIKKEEVIITDWAQDFWHFNKEQEETYEKAADGQEKHVKNTKANEPTPEEEEQFFAKINAIKTYNAYEFKSQAREEEREYGSREKAQERSHEAERDHETKRNHETERDHEPDQEFYEAEQEFYDEPAPDLEPDDDISNEYDDLSGGDLHDDGGPDLNNNGIPDDYEVEVDDYEH